MNNDLISREALKKKFDEHITANPNVSGVFELGKFIIDNAPTVCGNNPKWCESCVSKGKCASTRPQGEWIDEYWEDTYQEYYHTCSICKKDMRTTCYDNFCPNCGAKMITDESQ